MKNEKKPGKAELVSALVEFVKGLLTVGLWIGSIIAIFVWYDWKLLLILFIWTWANNIMLIDNVIKPLRKNMKVILKSIDFENGNGEETKT